MSFCFVLQPSIDYYQPTEVGRINLKEQGLGDLQGFCYFESKLFVLWGHVGGCNMNVYTAYYEEDTGASITHLDSMPLPADCIGSPRVDRCNHRIFIPCDVSGVVIARLEGDRLVTEKTLLCVEKPLDVDVISPDTAYVCDGDTYTVKVVDVTRDVITATLKKPEEVNNAIPMRLAVLGDRIMVMYMYGGPILAIYQCPYDSLDPIQVIPSPEDLNSVSAISTEARGHHFLLTDCKSRYMFVVDVKGNLLDTVNIEVDRYPCDCAVVGRQLWVGCSSGDIVFISSRDDIEYMMNYLERPWDFQESDPCDTPPPASFASSGDYPEVWDYLSGDGTPDHIWDDCDDSMYPVIDLRSNFKTPASAGLGNL